MKLTVLSNAECRARLEAGAAISSDRDKLAAELLRAELWGRRVSQRRSLLLAVIERARPCLSLGLEDLAAILESLEYQGDVTAGSNGRVAAAPLRAVDLGDGRFRLHGGPDTRRLSTWLESEITSAKTTREVSVSTNLGAFRSAVEAQGGALLTPERWSGLDSSEVADGSWLDGLDLDLGSQPQALDDDTLALDWRGYEPRAEATQSERFVNTPGSARLWRARATNGRRHWWWTNGERPESGKGLRLRETDALRTAFALDRVAGFPIAMRATTVEQGVEVAIAGDLPQAEYRYAATLGVRVQRSEPSGKPEQPGQTERAGWATFCFPRERWLRVEPLLLERLGLRV